MFLKKKGQSTAEYAIVIGLVVAVAAGILQIALKGGIRQKNTQAMNYMLGAGNDQLNATDVQAAMFSQDYRQTQVLGGDAYVDESVMQKGGSEKKIQRQATTTTSVSVETLNASNY
jgi:hypothetical protein